MLRDSGDPTRTVQTAATLVESPQAADLAARRLGPSWSRSRVLEAVEVAPEGESNILAVTATAETGLLAARVADEFAHASLDVRRRQLRQEVRAELQGVRERLAAVVDPEGLAAAELAARLDQLESVSNGDDPTLQLSQNATPPSTPLGLPAWAVIFLALVAGITLAAAAAILAELVNRRVRDEEDAIAIFPLPVLARVPRLTRRERARGLGAQWLMPPKVREAFRTLLVQLPARNEAGGRVIMVTSASTGDGKTTSAINLAVSLAASGHSTILLDFDIRKPDLALLLGIDEPVPLVSLLTPGRRHADLENMLAPKDPLLPTLYVLATEGGRPNEGALVDALSKRLPGLIRDASQQAEFVVVDTSPMGEVSDALRLTEDVDDIIVVARAGNTNRVNLEVMRDLLARTGNVPTGLIVIGKVPGVSRDYSDYGTREREQSGRQSGRRHLTGLS